ncbi:MAG: nucleotide exchange factor GrpE [Pirellulaceae bacterium]|nr:nucleotide exchange factor GrpE [Planctomycetales bacterium]
MDSTNGPHENESAAASEGMPGDEAFADETIDFTEVRPATESSDDERVTLLLKVQEAQDRALRSHAELENFRKRARREIEEQRRYAAADLVRDLLPVIDNFELALSAAGTTDDATKDGVLQGVRMVSQQMLSVLEQHGCRRVPGEPGTDFDPNVHEAIRQETHPSIAAGALIQVVRNGYQVHDRVIRPAHVIVSTGPASA